MKNLFLIILFFGANSTLANKVDSIKNDTDAIKFISKLFAKTYNDNHWVFSLNNNSKIDHQLICDSSTLKWKAKNWEKIDFNSDGKTDLFIIVNRHYRKSKDRSYNIYIAIDNGNDSFLLKELPGYIMFNCHMAMPLSIKNDPYILYQYYKTEYIVDKTDSLKVNYFNAVKVDTLIYKFGAFIEANFNPSPLKIRSIFFETSMCLGVCPKFQLSIYEDSTARFLAEMFNDKTGEFKAKLKTKDFSELINLLSYLDIRKLQNSYDIPATDLQSGKLIVYYFDGTMKEIDDYGLQGTMGLVRLYDLLFALRENQDWK